MAKDDMRVVMYKILRYLYECNRKGLSPSFEDMCYQCKLFKIPHNYWAQIMMELMDLGYIKGFGKIESKDGATIQMHDNPRITVSGVDYMEENSVMQKIKEELGTAFEILLTSVLSTL